MFLRRSPNREAPCERSNLPCPVFCMTSDRRCIRSPRGRHFSPRCHCQITDSTGFTRRVHWRIPLTTAPRLQSSAICMKLNLLWVMTAGPGADSCSRLLSAGLTCRPKFFSRFTFFLDIRGCSHDSGWLHFLPRKCLVVFYFAANAPGRSSPALRLILF